ncbi:MAG: DUF2341 domain-containing protein [Candidatus Pacebacteria bacterium]|nr:DUF2341 domain-containing protein [Candidatus Paceibacterota bacterium]
MNNDFSDIRFSVDGSEKLGYWIESKTDSVSAKVWVKIPSIPANSSVSLGIYYGNSSATAQSAISNVFIREISNLKGFWNMDESIGNSVGDYSGYSNNGTAYGATTIDGKFDKARLFDGQNDYITGPSTGFPSGTTARSLTYWAKPTANTGNYQIVFHYGPITAQQGWGSGITASDQKWYVSQIGLDTRANSIDWGNWVFIAITQNDSGGYIIYQNGIQIATGTMATNTVLSNFLIGQHSSNYWFSGVIDDLAFYDKVLNVQEITDIYNNRTYAIPSHTGNSLVRKYSEAEPSYVIGQEEMN